MGLALQVPLKVEYLQIVNEPHGNHKVLPLRIEEEGGVPLFKNFLHLHIITRNYEKQGVVHDVLLLKEARIYEHLIEESLQQTLLVTVDFYDFVEVLEILVLEKLQVTPHLGVNLLDGLSVEGQSTLTTSKGLLTTGILGG